MRLGGERDDFDPDAMVMFQFHRKAELLQHRSGDTRVEPPAEPIKLVRIGRHLIREDAATPGRSLAEIWGIPKQPFAGSE